MRGDKDSNLFTFLQSVAKYSPPVDSWLKRDGRYRWLSHPVQNGMLRVLSHAVIRQIIQDVALSKYFSVVADETTDISTKQQLSLCVRFVNGKLEPQEMFLGLVDMPKADASTIVQAIKSAVTACGLNLLNCRGQGYDGAAVMSGITSGVQARFKQDFPSMLYIHCSGHQLNLVVQDCFKSCTEGSNSLKILQCVASFIKSSPKRNTSFNNVQIESGATKSVRPLCPTRWVLRFEGLAAFMENYVNILDWLGDVVTSNDFDRVTVANAQSYLGSLENFTIFFSLRTLHNLLAIINPLHVKVQQRSMRLRSFKSALEDVLVLINANIT